MPPCPYRPQLALLAERAPEGPAWLHETKYDGYRIGCAIAGGRATLWSRRGKDWTREFPEVAAAAARLPVRSALLDGEVAAVLPDGRTSFQALQGALSGEGRERLFYFAFDLLRLDGEDLRGRPLALRKAALERLLADAGGIVRYAAHVEGSGSAVFREACRLGLEGIVSKRRDEPHRPGRGPGWVKTKCVKRQELLVGGFTDPAGPSRDALGALLVGYREGGALRFAGKVGTGFTNAEARALRRRLDRLAARECPFDPRPEGPLGRNARWVRPVLACEVAFAEWTEDGKVRHASFRGLREDVRARDVVRELPSASEAGPPTGSASSSRAADSDRPRRRPSARPGRSGPGPPS